MFVKPGFQFTLNFNNYLISICLLRSFVFMHVSHVVFHHHGDFERERILKAADIKSGALFELFKTVDQGVAVHVELARGL